MKEERVSRVDTKPESSLCFSFFIFLLSYFTFQFVSYAATSHTVLILHHSFEPDSVLVQPGDTVRWLHQDAAAHTVTGNGTEKWNSEHMEWGDAYLRVFENTGAHDYVCNYHPMSGKVVVGGSVSVLPDGGDGRKPAGVPGGKNRNEHDALGRTANPRPSPYEAVIRFKSP